MEPGKKALQGLKEIKKSSRISASKKKRPSELPTTTASLNCAIAKSLNCKKRSKRHRKRLGDTNGRLLKEEVDEALIAQIVAKWTGIPVQKMLEGEAEKLLHLEESLEKRVVGQHFAIAAVSEAIRRSRSGLNDPTRPIGVFLFVGPTGVGKTELTKALADQLFNNEEAIIRLDMSEYMEKHASPN